MGTFSTILLDLGLRTPSDTEEEILSKLMGSPKSKSIYIYIYIYMVEKVPWLRRPLKNLIPAWFTCMHICEFRGAGWPGRRSGIRSWYYNRTSMFRVYKYVDRNKKLIATLRSQFHFFLKKYISHQLIDRYDRMINYLYLHIIILRS